MEFLDYTIERSPTADFFLVRGTRERDGKQLTLGCFSTVEEAEHWIEEEKRGEHKTIRAFLSATGQFYLERDGKLVPIDQLRKAR